MAKNSTPLHEDPDKLRAAFPDMTEEEVMLARGDPGGAAQAYAIRTGKDAGEVLEQLS